MITNLHKHKQYLQLSADKLNLKFALNSGHVSNDMKDIFSWCRKMHSPMGERLKGL